MVIPQPVENLLWGEYRQGVPVRAERAREAGPGLFTATGKGGRCLVVRWPGSIYQVGCAPSHYPVVVFRVIHGHKQVHEWRVSGALT
jgi:hypothetical protein